MIKDSGFTLIETLVVLSITAILSCCAITYSQTTTQKNQLPLIASNLLHNLQYARSEAIKRNQIITLCGTEDFKTCSQSWQKGYLIFSESDNNPNKELIKINTYTQRPVTDLIITGQFNTKTNQVRFTPSGQSKDNGRFTLEIQNAPQEAPAPYTLVVFHSGRCRFA